MILDMTFGERRKRSNNTPGREYPTSRVLMPIAPRGHRAVEGMIRNEVGRATDGDEVRAIHV
jgi:hypothetical protein